MSKCIRTLAVMAVMMATMIMLSVSAFALDLEINNAEDLKDFRDKVNRGETDYDTANVVLMANIDLGGEVWEPISTSANIESSSVFKGVFDGNGHTISNFKLADSATPDGKGLGFFSQVKDATIKNLTLENVQVSSTKDDIYIGALVGEAENVTIENITINEADISGESTVGGVIGHVSRNYSNNLSNITGCKINESSLSGKTVGGIAGVIGDNYNVEIGKMENCHTDSKTNIISTGIAGGIAGKVHMRSDNSIMKSSNAANIKGDEAVGGIVGYLIDGEIDECFNTGDIEGYAYIGGIVGEIQNSDNIKNSYNTGTVEGMNMVGGIAGSMGVTSSMPSSYSSFENGYETVNVENVYNAGLTIILGGIPDGDGVQSYGNGIASLVFGKVSNSVSLGAEIKSYDKNLSDEADFNRIANQYEDDGLEWGIFNNNYARKDMLVYGKWRPSEDATSTDGKDIDLTDPDWKATAFATWDANIWDFHDDNVNALPTLRNISISQSPMLEFYSPYYEFTLQSGEKINIYDPTFLISREFELDISEIPVGDPIEAAIDEEIKAEIENFAIYDISFRDDSGNIVQNLNLDGYVEVYLPIPENYDVADLSVIYVNDGGLDTTYKVTIKEFEGVKCATFMTNHFSPYALVDMISAGDIVSSGGGGGGGSSKPDDTISNGDSIDSDDLQDLIDDGETLKIEGANGIEVEFDTDALEAILGLADGKEIEFIAKEADESELNEEQKIVIGDNLVLDLQVLADGEQFTDFETGEVSVSVPYELEDGETAENLKVYYVDEDGNKTLIQSELVDGILTFKTNHFSLYMVTYEIMSFVDVLDTDWFYESVIYTYENGLMNGISDTEFDPNGPTTRAMIWTVLARMEAVETEAAEGEMWYSVAQTWAIENEISDGTDPDGNINREELVTMLYRYAAPEAVTAQTLLGQFTDSESISEWAVSAMEWAVANGIISGKDDGILDPQGTAARAEIAAIIHRFVENS